MYMVILLQGVRMMVGEINGSFKGWQDRLFLTLFLLSMLQRCYLFFTQCRNVKLRLPLWRRFNGDLLLISRRMALALFPLAVRFGVLANRIGVPFRNYLYVLAGTVRPSVRCGLFR